MLVLLGLGVRYCRLRLLVSLLALVLLLIPTNVSATTPVEWLALNIYHESRSESLDGQVAVAIVTINRLKSDCYPNTIEKVVTQKDQFSWYWDGEPDTPLEPKAYDKCYELAITIMGLYKSGGIVDLTRQMGLDGVLWYHNKHVYPKWADEYQYVMNYEDHLFYRRI